MKAENFFHAPEISVFSFLAEFDMQIKKNVYIYLCLHILQKNIGIMAIFALSFLTPYFYYIPKATLSAVLISAVMFLFDWRILQPLVKGSSKFKFITFIISHCIIGT